MAHQVITSSSREQNKQQNLLQHQQMKTIESNCNFVSQFNNRQQEASMHFYQNATESSAAGQQNQQTKQHLYVSSTSSASYYTCQMCGSQQCECLQNKKEASSSDVTYLMSGSEHHQSPASSSSSSSSSSNSSSLASSIGSTAMQQTHHLNQYAHEEYQQQQEFQLVQQVSSQIDRQSRISSSSLYNYSYKNQQQIDETGNWNQMLEDHHTGGSQLDNLLRLEPILESTNNQQQTYVHHQQPHKSLSIDLQDFNNNQEQEEYHQHQIGTTTGDVIFDHSIDETQQDNHHYQYTNRRNNEEQLYTTTTTNGTYFTNSASALGDNYHEQCMDHGNMNDNIQQSETLVQPLPSFETIDDNNQRSRDTLQIQYSSQPSNYDPYDQASEHAHPYQHQQEANNLKSSLENSQYQTSQVQTHNQNQTLWNEQSTIAQDHLVTSQNCSLSEQHSFLGDSQYVTKEELPYDSSLQQLTMHCDSYSNQTSTTTSDSASTNTQPDDTCKNRTLKGRRGRPRKKGLRSKNKVNGKLWEFIRDLLLNERTNPSFIRWERREDGVFKFVQSDKVAKMWGERKQNPKMTYEKLSRAMRYYYKSKVLLPVFGRRLVYKFGPNATGWLPSSNETAS